MSKLAREAEHARAGRTARVIAKMNALVEPQAIEALYRASCAGVKVDLIIRGVCALRPGVPGVSENIRCARSSGASSSIRACFISRTAASRRCTARAPTGWSATSSAAWRSLSPSSGTLHRERILRDLNYCLSDTCQAWKLQPDGRYERVARAAHRPVNAQMELLGSYAAGRTAAPVSRACALAHGRALCRQPGDRRATRCRRLAPQRAAAEDPQPEAARPQVLGLLLQIRRRQRVILQPARRKFDFQRLRRRFQLDRRQRRRAAPPMQQHRQAQQHDQIQRAAVPRRHELLDALPRSSLRRWPPTMRASRRCSSREKPGMSAFSSR